MAFKTVLPGIDPDKIGGRYVIQLMDDRGKVKEIVKSNYVTPLWANVSKFWACGLPLVYKFPYNNGVSLFNGDEDAAFANRYVRPFAKRPFPWGWVLLTDSAEAEDTTDHWLKGNVTAYASLYKVTVAASGPRGIINEAECDNSDNGRIWKWVFDWSTQQGNGSYQTLGMGVFNVNSAFAIGAGHITSVGPHGIVGPLSTEVAGTIKDQYISNGKWFLVMSTSDTVVTLWQANLPAGLATTDYDGSGKLHDATSMTWTQIGGNNPGGISSGTSGSNRYRDAGLSLHYDPSTGDLFYAEKWVTASTHGEVGRMTLSGTNVWSANPFGTGGFTTSASTFLANTQPHGLAVVGTKVYVSFADATSGNNTKIIRFANTGGAIEASFTLPNSLTALGGMTTDGTDLFLVTTTGLCQITTSGAFVENFGKPAGSFGSQSTEDGVSPWSVLDNFQVPPGGNTSQQTLFPAAMTSGGGFLPLNLATGEAISFDWPVHPTTLSSSSTFGEDITFFNNKLWISSSGTINSRRVFLGITGANCISRAVLDSPVTKTSSQTMKVSYELTLPDMDTFWHTHPDRM